MIGLPYWRAKMKLTDTQLVALSAAFNREDRSILPLPDHIKGGAIVKVCTALLAKGLAAEVTANKGDPIWREAGKGPAAKLIATDAAREALGIPADEPANIVIAVDLDPKAAPPAASKTRRTNTKQEQLIAMLQAAAGASIDEIVAAFGWQAHTVRGAIAGALKKKLGLKISSEKIEGRGRVYRIIA